MSSMRSILRLALALVLPCFAPPLTRTLVDQALAVVMNAKTQRTSVCNAAESLLVHADVADTFVPRVVRALQGAGVTVHGDPAFAAYDGVVPATDDDHAREYLSLDLSAAVVPSRLAQKVSAATALRSGG